MFDLVSDISSKITAGCTSQRAVLWSNIRQRTPKMNGYEWNSSMNAKALYFPHIQVPNTAWTTQALLYWDRVASIVPMRFMRDPEPLSPFMRDLLSEGLVEPIFPQHHLREIDRFNDCFIDFAEARLRPRLEYFSRELTEGRVTRVHSEKLGSIPDYLVEIGLAQRISWDWFEMPRTIANCFMAYLATTLGAVPSVNATPITDRAIYASTLGAPRILRSNSNVHVQKARGTILRLLLPVPKDPVEFGALLRFKRDHGRQLPALRAKVEAFCASVAAVPGAPQREVMTEAFVRDCSAEIAEIEAAMRPSFGTVVFGALSPLFGAGLSLKETALGNEVAYAGAALSLAGASYAAEDIDALDVADLGDLRRMC